MQKNLKYNFTILKSRATNPMLHKLWQHENANQASHTKLCLCGAEIKCSPEKKKNFFFMSSLIFVCNYQSCNYIML